MLTQKYKQQQQQVRVQTSESNYAKGMFFSDVPLTEGYSKVLVNWDIDPNTGKLTPRKGLLPMYYSVSEDNSASAGNHPVLHNAHYTYTNNKQATLHRDTATTKHILGILRENTKVFGGGYPNSSDCYLTNITINDNADILLNHTSLFTQRNGYKTTNAFRYLKNPGVHNASCKDKSQFVEPVGTFAYDNNYYYFTHTYRDSNKEDWKKLGVIPNAQLPYYFESIFNKQVNYGGSLQLDETHPLAYGEPGTYYVVQVSGTLRPEAAQYAGKYGIIYYDSKGEAELWGFYADCQDTPEEMNQLFLNNVDTISLRILDESLLCYTKLGRDIQPEEILLDPEAKHGSLNNTQYYTCVVDPQKLNPTEASSWGYNMLLNDPYDFKCEKTAANVITILGILPYDSTGKVTLTPRKNQELTLKAYYRAPDEYYTDVAKGTYYATAKQYIEVSTTAEDDTVTTEKRDPKTLDELEKFCGKTEEKLADYSSYAFGSWWYCTDEKQYYMVIPATSLTTKKLDKPSATKPAASVLLAPTLSSASKKEIRVRWQIRTVDSSDWIDLYNEKLSLNGKDKEHQPFTVTTTMSSDELLVKFTISDPASPDELTNEETVITTNTIGLSLVSDELANTLNLTPVKYALGTCTGMCEWENRLVLWGVQDALNTVFVSDVNNPTFFPYPNNIDILPEAVRAVYNFGADLLVLTASALYRLIWDTENAGWTHKLIQQNLNITEADIPMCCVVKNMFFFKSGDAYYMLAPKAANAAGVKGYTTITEVSAPIKELLLNFHDNIANIFTQITPGKFYAQYLKNNLVNYKAIPAHDKVILQYTYNYTDAAVQEKYDDPSVRDAFGTVLSEGIDIQFTSNLYFNVQLVYRLDTGVWSIKAYTTQKELYGINSSVLQNEQYACVENAGNHIIVYAFEEQQNYAQHYINGKPFTCVTFAEGVQDCVLTQLIYSNAYKRYELYAHPITSYYINGVSEDQKNVDIPTNNYQFLDTGNRDINTDMKKRFREYQFKIRNINATSLGLRTSFLVDGSVRKDLQRYVPRYITDPTTGESVIVVERTFNDSQETYKVEKVVVSTRMLQDSGELTPTTLANLTDPDYWVLEQSALPGRTFTKVRVLISGKGYTPRAQLLSTNLKTFEVLGHNWVYRTMHGR